MAGLMGFVIVVGLLFVMGRAWFRTFDPKSKAARAAKWQRRFGG